MKDIQVIATSPGEMVRSNAALVEWCAGKIASIETDKAEAEENYESARRSKWKSSPFKRVAKRLEKSIAYYGKIKTALLDGYYILPPMTQFEAFAVRTERLGPTYRKSNYRWDLGGPRGQLLPQERGRYVGMPQVWTTMVTDGDGKTHKNHYERGFQDIEFPVTLVKPEIIKRTEAAMARKVFDQIGVVSSGCGDPIIVGRLINPTRSNHFTDFFVAWWLDTEDF